MKKRSVKTIIILIIAAFVLTPASLWAFEDAILAVVNNHVITLKDLRDYINSTYMALAAQGLGEAKIEEMMADMEENGLTKLIEDRLILSRANEIGMTIKEELVDEKIEEIKANYPSEEAFLTALIDHGGTLSDMRKKIEDQYKIKYVIDHEIRSKIYVSPQEVTEFYEKHMNEFQKKERIRLQSIFISFGSNKIAAKEKAKEALKKIQEGEDFNAVAEEYSDAPSIGTVERGQLLPSIEKVVFHLSEGVPSDIIELETGFYIFKLVERLPAEMASLADVRDDIRQRLYRNKFRQRFIDWIDELKEDAYIEIKE